MKSLDLGNISFVSFAARKELNLQIVSRSVFCDLPYTVLILQFSLIFFLLCVLVTLDNMTYFDVVRVFHFCQTANHRLICSIFVFYFF